MTEETAFSYRQSPIAVLDADPELGQGIAEEELATARRRSQARVVGLSGSIWDPTATVATEEAQHPGAEWLGLLVIDGVLIRQVTVAARASCEVLGAGDVLRPWDTSTGELDFPNTVEWRVARHTTLALLDAGFVRRMAPWPTVTNQVVARLSRRLGYESLAHAVSHTTLIDDRIPAVFWLLAQRWGKARSDGVCIDVPLTHELLGVLVGARRPTVTIALGHLSEAGVLTREGKDRWVLSWQAVERLTEAHGGDVPAEMISRAGGARIVLTRSAGA